MKKAENIIVGISIGDLNGIGSEIVLKTFEDALFLFFFTPVIFSIVKTLSFLLTSFYSTSPLHVIDLLFLFIPVKINVLNLCHYPIQLEYFVNN